MAARRSRLRTRQSICSLLPCRQLPGRIRGALYRRQMKMSVSWISCSVSCGTFLFGFLWESSRQVWVPKGHIAPFLRVVKMAFHGAMRIASCFIGLAACGTGNTHRHLAPNILCKEFRLDTDIHPDSSPPHTPVSPAARALVSVSAELVHNPRSATA